MAGVVASNGPCPRGRLGNRLSISTRRKIRKSQAIDIIILIYNPPIHGDSL